MTRNPQGKEVSIVETMPSLEAEMPMELEDFLDWLKSALELDDRPKETDRLREDLSVDDLKMLQAVARFDEATVGNAAVDCDIFAVETVRGLYLYYLTVLSMPLE